MSRYYNSSGYSGYDSQRDIEGELISKLKSQGQSVIDKKIYLVRGEPSHALMKTAGWLVNEFGYSINWVNSKISTGNICYQVNENGTLWPKPSELQGVSDHQRAQYAKATQSRVGCLYGGPGTGKSHVVREIVRAIKERHKSLNIGLAAPTGKAALRIVELLNQIEIYELATTIHTMLKVGRNGHDGGGWGFEYCEDNPLPYDIVFVDEASMISVDLMASLFKAIGPRCQVLFIGDPNQLPPVGPGRPFSDFVKLGVPSGHLTEIHRFAGRIAEVCKRINAGEVWQPSPRIDIDGDYPENMRHVETRRETQQVETILETIRKLRDNRGFDPMNDVQVLCATNKFRSRLNGILQAEFNPSGATHKDFSFRVGDKVVCTRNQRIETYSEYANAPIRYTANGEIGRVDRFWTDDRKRPHMLVGMPEGTQVKITKGGAGDWELANAVTVWKAQGSQWPVVINCIEDSHGADMICDRAYHYTGISRASKLSFTIGSRAAMDRQCRRTISASRKTLLVEKVRAIDADNHLGIFSTV